MKRFFTNPKIDKNDIIALTCTIIFIIVWSIMGVADVFPVAFSEVVDQAYSTKKDFAGNTYILDSGHERVLAVDPDGVLLYSVEYPTDDEGSGWYIDDFALDENGNLYLNCTEWDGFFLSKEAILRYDNQGNQLDKPFEYYFDQYVINKHRTYGLTVQSGRVHFLYLNEDTISEYDIPIAEFSSEYGEIEPSFTYEAANALNAVYEARYYADSYVILFKNGTIAVPSGNTFTTIVDITQTNVPGCVPYSFDIAADGMLYLTDIRDNRVLCTPFDNINASSQFEEVVSDTYSQVVFADRNGGVIVTEIDCSNHYTLNGNDEGPDLSISTVAKPVSDIAWIVARLAMNLVLLLSILVVLIRVIFIIRAYKISSTIKVEIGIGIGIVIVIATLVFMLIKEFKTSYSDALKEQISMTAYAVANAIRPEDMEAIDSVSDFGGEAYMNICDSMNNYFYTGIDFYTQIYCNIIKWDGDPDEVGYAIAYYDQSVGTYFPLDEDETQEVIQIYENKQPVWNDAKSDATGTYIYVKVPVLARGGDVVGVVSIGMDTFVMDNMIIEMRNRTLLSIVTIVLLIWLAGTEIIALVNSKAKYKAQLEENPNRKSLPVYVIRILVFSVFTAFNMVSSFLPVFIMNNLDTNLPIGRELLVSIPMTINIFIMGVMSLFCAKLVRKMGVKKLAVLSGISSLTGNLLILLIQSYYAIVAGLILDGIGVGLMSNAIYILITYIKDEQDQTEGFATYNSSCVSGTNFGMMLGAVLAVNLTQRNVFMFVAIIWLIVIGLVVLVSNTMAGGLSPESADTGGEQPKVSFGKFIKNKLIIGFIFLIQNPYIVFNSFVFFFVPIFCDEHGYSETMSSILLMVYAIFSVYLSDVLTKKSLEIFKDRAMYVAYTINILAVILYAWTENMAGLILALVMLGVSASFGKSVQQTYFMKMNSVKEFGEDNAMGIYNFTENIGESLGPIIFSYLMSFSPLALGVSVFGGVIMLLGGTHFVTTDAKIKMRRGEKR